MRRIELQMGLAAVVILVGDRFGDICGLRPGESKIFVPGARLILDVQDRLAPLFAVRLLFADERSEGYDR